MADYDKVILKNQSPFLLAIHNGSYTYWLHPFMADVFPYLALGDQKLYCEPSLQGVLSGTANIITAAFYLKSETVEGNAYPAILSQFSTTLGDNPTQFFSGNLTVDVENSGITGVNPAAFNSYQMRVTFSNGAQSATNFAILAIRFYADSGHTILLEETVVEINASNANTYVAGPVRSQFMTLIWHSGAGGGTLQIQAWLSNRSRERIIAYEGLGLFSAPPSGTDRILLVRDGPGSVAAGTTSAHRFCPLFAPGLLDIFCDPQVGVNTVVWNFYFGDMAIFFSTNPQSVVSKETRLAPLAPLHYTVTNNGAGAVTPILTVIARDW